jgi:predicted amidophosphoribosyltransferase
VPGVGVIRAGLLHEGVARRLVHVLKYRGVVAAARVLAGATSTLLEPGAVLVPVPRVTWRRLRYGIDPALELAGAVAAVTGSRMVRLLAPPLWGRRRAGHDHGTAPRFRLRSSSPPPMNRARLVLVDDVVTTGATLQSAARALGGCGGALTATSAGLGRHGLSPMSARTTRFPDQSSPEVGIWR